VGEAEPRPLMNALDLEGGRANDRETGVDQG
jgi:hypothetical protein